MVGITPLAGAGHPAAVTGQEGLWWDMLALDGSNSIR